MKQYLKLNNNNKELSLGNFCRIIKENSLNKKLANQTEIFSIILNIDDINDSTINSYCLGNRSIGYKYKEIVLNYKKEFNNNIKYMLNIISNLLNLIEGYNNTKNYTINNINNNNKIIDISKELFNISKNDKSVKNNYIDKFNNYIKNNDYYSFLIEIIFYIILEKKQPIYIEDEIINHITNILNNTNISIYDLENFLNIEFNDGVNYTYSIKKLAKENNPYAALELGLMEYNGEITGTPRYNIAYNYFKIAANYNHPRANYLIAKLLLEGNIGKKNKKDISLAITHLNKSIELKSTAALNLMGLYYLNYEKNIDNAIKYFKEAIKNNYVYSYNNLGKIYEDKKQYKKAYSYYINSANLEESWACNKIGEFYRLGKGTNKDIEKAYYYYNLSQNVPIKLLCPWSKYNLAKYFYLNGNYEAKIEKDINKAITLFKESSTIIESLIELLYYYTSIYLTNNNLDIIYKYIDLIEKHPNYNKDYKIIIETNIKKIINNNSIDKNIYNITNNNTYN